MPCLDDSGNPILDSSGNPIQWRIVLHIKVLQEPQIAVEDMVADMQKVYSTAGIQVQVGSYTKLDVPAVDTVVDLDGCSLPACSPPPHELHILHHHPQSEIDELYMNSNDVPTDELSVYFVFDTSNPSTQYGCAAHPPGKPGVIITEFAIRWTMAHEVGHVLGLCHVTSATGLMNSSNLSKMRSTPKLSHNEKRIMHNSSLLKPC